jgi:hypothetical protein
VATLLSGELMQSAGYHEVVSTPASPAASTTITRGDNALSSDVRKMILKK